MSSSYCGPLAAWCNAFFAGRVSVDEVVDAVRGEDAPHRVDGLGIEQAPLHELVSRWRRSGEPVRMNLPVPGDTGGLPGTALRAAALDAGEVAFAGSEAAVPERYDYSPSSRPADVVWTLFTADQPVRLEWHQLADVSYELTTAIRECASALTAAQVTATGDPTAALADARRAGEWLNLPPGHPPRAVSLLSQAERLSAVLDLALADPAGGAVDRMGMAARDSALRPLTTAVRRALVAGYNAGADPERVR